MAIDHLTIRTRSPAYPLVRFLASFPIALFCATLATDLAYWSTANIMWADFSAWLLAIGMAFGVVAALAGLVAWVMRARRVRSGETARPGWPVALGSLLVLLVAFVNNLVHSRDAWTSIVPEGIVLSVATVILILFTIFGSAMIRPRDPVVAYQGVRT